MPNPLLEMRDLPPFSRIRPAQVETAIDQVLADNREGIARIVAAERFDWDHLIPPLEEMEDRLHRTWSPVSHLNAVLNSEPLRGAYNACLPKLSAYHTELAQNVSLHRAYRALAEAPDASRLPAQFRMALEHALRDFRLAGVDLPEHSKTRFKEIMQQLSTLQSRFQDNVLDATQSWTLHITDPDRLAGVPASALGVLRQNAARKDLDGWLLTLESPSYLPVMMHADDRELRRQAYQAFVTRGSDQGPDEGRFDNGAVMAQILALRHEAAELTGFGNFAERSLATKMAESAQEVIGFLEDLAARSRPQAQREFSALGEFARKEHGVVVLEAWDVAYYSEKLRVSEYDVSQEMLRPYFPEARVVSGLFAVAETLFGVRLQCRDDIDVWHPDVRCYQVVDNDSGIRALLYMDLYARANKRGGAWMSDYRGRRRLPAGVQTPVAYITCNFTPPLGEDPALFTHDEVITLFHEFGHALHHMLTRVDCAAVAGINGVEWDAVELPSQLMENWCWEREALDLISGHYQSGERLPDSLYQRMRAARTFQTAMQMVRQLEFALFDFELHAGYDPIRPTPILDLWHRVRDRVAVAPVPDFARFPHAFSHIFAGGYAAGYYSYKWAEVLAADAFSSFLDHGIFDRETGRRYLREVLEMGGSRRAMDNFVAFRGRKPRVEPLLEHSGITARGSVDA